MLTIPDIYHSYLGLAALSLMGQPELKPVHPAAAISVEAWDRVAGLALQSA